MATNMILIHIQLLDDIGILLFLEVKYIIYLLYIYTTWQHLFTDGGFNAIHGLTTPKELVRVASSNRGWSPHSLGKQASFA